MQASAKPSFITPHSRLPLPEPWFRRNVIPAPPKIPQALVASNPTNPLGSTFQPAADAQGMAFQDYQSLFASQRLETAEPVSLSLVEGAIPADFPSGTYYLAGPGIFSDDYGSTVHPLDGHGYLRAFTIDGGTGEVTYAARYVRTEAHAEENDAAAGRWRFTHRGPFSVLRGGRMVGNTKVMKNVANTSVVRWGGRLLCFWEGGAPYEVELRTLDTVGRFEFDGVDGRDSIRENGQKFRDAWDVGLLAAELLKPVLYGMFKMPPRRLLSHYKIDAKRKRLLMVSCNAEDMLLPQSNLTFYEYDANFKLLERQEFSIGDHLMIHDWAFTDTHYIIFGNRIRLDIAGSLSAMCGLSPTISALSVNPSKKTSPVYLLPRFPNDDAQERDWRVPVEAPMQLWLLHIGNAFQKRDESGNLEIQILASACSYRWFSFTKMFGYNWKTGKLDPSAMNTSQRENKLLPHLIQVTINVNAAGKYNNCHIKPLDHWDKTSDFPVINPLFSGTKNAYTYASAASGSSVHLRHFPFDTVVKLNIKDSSAFTWFSGRHRFIGEPVFVPNGPGEDDGYLLVVQYEVSAGRCCLVVLDPKRLGRSNALVAKIAVPRHLSFPMGFHGFWARDAK